MTPHLTRISDPWTVHLSEHQPLALKRAKQTPKYRIFPVLETVLGATLAEPIHSHRDFVPSEPQPMRGPCRPDMLAFEGV